MVEKPRYQRDEYFDFGKRHGASQVLRAPELEDIAMRVTLTEAAYNALCVAVERQERVRMLERERLMFWSARRCWKERHDKTQKGETWGKWFERMYGESLEDYAKRAAADGITQKVMEYEIATFGKSPLQEPASEDAA